jgi:hypothetical protein
MFHVPESVCPPSQPSTTELQFGGYRMCVSYRFLRFGHLGQPIRGRAASRPHGPARGLRVMLRPAPERYAPLSRMVRGHGACLINRQRVTCSTDQKLSAARQSTRLHCSVLQHPLQRGNLAWTAALFRTGWQSRQELRLPRENLAIGSSWEPQCLPFSATTASCWSFVYSAVASFRMGMSGSASFQSSRKSL